MDITWSIETVLQSSCKTVKEQIEPMTIWKNVKIEENTKKNKVNIVKDGFIFTNIPTNWYLIHN